MLDGRHSMRMPLKLSWKLIILKYENCTLL